MSSKERFIKELSEVIANAISQHPDLLKKLSLLQEPKPKPKGASKKKKYIPVKERKENIRNQFEELSNRQSAKHKN